MEIMQSCFLLTKKTMFFWGKKTTITRVLWVNRQLVRIARASYYMGRASMIPFSLLWIPVSRGSPFLRLMNVPFEQAVKYHRWLSILTLFMLTLHSAGYIIYYVATHRTQKASNLYTFFSIMNDSSSTSKVLKALMHVCRR